MFLRLGLTSFGGPVAHIGYFRDELVMRRRWLSERAYADLVALCQFLPGPASSQVGMALGMMRAGYGGALAAWAGFTLPSALVLILFALGLAHYSDVLADGALRGLKVVAVAVVAQAVWGMGRALCTDRTRVTIMGVAACAMLLGTTTWGQVAVMAAAGLAGVLLIKSSPVDGLERLPLSIGARTGAMWLALFAILLVALPLLVLWLPSVALARVDAFYRAGALVFGGGHVVLPLLQAEVVASGWVQEDAFLAGYGAAQAVPGPLFTFAAFLGASMLTPPTAWVGGMICLVAIFVPAFLLVAGTLPFWAQLRCHARVQAALAGVNAGVVGMLVAALYHPVWTSAIHAPQDLALALIALIGLLAWRAPPWLVVIGCAVAAWGLGLR